ncbi:MAG: DUF1501 domain-containing protein [Myxococcota bacterium]
MSRPIQRRTLLKGLLGAAAASHMGVARAALNPFMPLPATAAVPTYKVLEVFLVGAISHRDTLWVEGATSDHRPARQTFDAATLADHGMDAQERFYIGDNPLPDGTSEPIHLGPWATSLPDTWLDRARLLTMAHDRPVHRLAQFASLTGQGFGREGATSMGAALASSGEQAYVIASCPHRAPHALVPAQKTSPTAPVAPVYIPFQSTTLTDDLAARATRPHRNEQDALRQALRNGYATRLTHAQTGTRLRSAAFDAYEGAASNLAASDDLLGIVAGHNMSVSQLDFNNENTTTAATIAGDLFDAGARHVCLLEAGIGDIFDSHNNSDPWEVASKAISNNANVTLKRLFDALVSADIDLDTTLIVVHSEFGRTWTPSETSDHWSDGYAALVMGGPLGAGQQGIVGSMSYEARDVDTVTVASPGAFSPADLRAAMMVAAGCTNLEALLPVDELSFSTHHAAFDTLFA